MTNEFRNKIIKALATMRENFTGSDAKFAISLGINAAVYNQIKQGKTDKVLSDAKWISLARAANVSLNDTVVWKAADTPIFKFISAQLEVCQKKSISSLLCDLNDIGKTFTAMHYARTHKNAVYVDCGQVKSKQRLIRYIAQSFGVSSNGKYSDVYEDLVFYLKTLSTPLIILDEAGDLQNDAFLELKSLWNRLEYQCGFYMMGAEGLQERMRRSISNKKVGYGELFSRFGKRYLTVFVRANDKGEVVRMSGEERNDMLRKSAAMIIKANTDADANIILNRTLGEDNTPSLRRVFNIIALKG